MGSVGQDWAAVMDRLLDGDRLALLEVSRLISGFLRRWNAFDFRDEWDDLIQEVVLATGLAIREGRIRERKAVFGYLRSTARYKFSDRLKQHLRWNEDGTLPWDDALESSIDPDPSGETDAALGSELDAALAQLNEPRRAAVLAVYAEGQTYEEAALAIGMPLGTLKRALQDGLGQLRRALRPRPPRTGT